MLKLRDWANRERFPPSEYLCPQCGGPALMDEWPPNYWGGKSWGNDITGELHSEDSGSIKHVCCACKIAFRVNCSIIREVSADGVEKREELYAYADIVPLVERDGEWLTPHDVQKDEYKAEHGEYQQEVYY